MTHLTTRNVGGFTQVLYQTPKGIFSYDLRRCVIGMTYPERRSTDRTALGHAVLVGERMFFSEQDYPPESQYVILDEAQHNTLAELYNSVISLKDRYLVEQTFVPASPRNMFLSVRDLEGLTWYRGDADRYRWKDFVSLKTVSGVREYEIPDSVSRDLEQWLSTDLKYPDSGQPILNAKADTNKRLVAVSELPTNKTLEGVQRDDEMVCNALWLAVHGLETTMKWTPEPKEGPLPSYGNVG